MLRANSTSSQNLTTMVAQNDLAYLKEAPTNIAKSSSIYFYDPPHQQEQAQERHFYNSWSELDSAVRFSNYTGNPNTFHYIHHEPEQLVVSAPATERYHGNYNQAWHQAYYNMPRQQSEEYYTPNQYGGTSYLSLNPEYPQQQDYQPIVPPAYVKLPISTTPYANDSHHKTVKEPRQTRYVAPVSNATPATHPMDSDPQTTPVASPQVKKARIAGERRRRQRFTKYQTTVLEDYYSIRKDPPPRQTKIDLSKQTGLSVAQVSHWFANKRCRDKK